jgi:hypothetical protein
MRISNLGIGHVASRCANATHGLMRSKECQLFTYVSCADEDVFVSKDPPSI